MKKLIECCDMMYSDGTFLLQPKRSCELDLVMLGFNGTEKWLRLTCRQNKSNGISNGTWEYEATICDADGESYSWDWGFHGYTLISKGLSEKQRKIVEACQMYCDDNGIRFPGRGW